MRTLNAIFILLLIGVLMCSLPGNAAASKQSITSMCDDYGGKIKSDASREDYLDAIIAAAEFERALLALYPEPSYELGLYQSERHHISFHNTFEGWEKEDVLQDLSETAGLQELGSELILSLLSDDEAEALSIIFMDWGRISQMLAYETPIGQGIGDQELLLLGQLMAQMFGVVESQDFTKIGGHDVLEFGIAAPMLGPPMSFYLLEIDDRLYGFFLVSSLTNHKRNVALLQDLIKTIDFNYMPPDSVKINAARAKITNRENISQILECVNDLAVGGEYGTACNELTSLRLILANRMPGPEIDGNIGRYSAYGITFKNPDSDRWNLSVLKEAGMGGLILEDRYSVNGCGIMVGVINTVITYGPSAVEMMENLAEEDKKMFISNGGRGGLMTMGGEIESERYRNYKGELAYEGIASTNIPSVKIKAIVFLKPGYLVMILMMMDAKNFSKATDELEKILDKDLEI
jgi:hypothetical protein